ncbi:MAG: 3-isopropylmalate dehydratase large subunit [Desulfovibrio sp.]|jgi:3-isopropylmalate/(R)-2-methylmalate dehydratase large subunit|nr:3-isopropylmalate dehydratase large subunit [Desulfovibrio sp.]
MHALEKILALKAGKTAVTTGEIVNCEVDWAGINDLYLQTVRSFHEIGGKRLAKPDRVVMFMDHYAPASTIIQADNQKQFRAFLREHGAHRIMDVNQGVCHQVLADNGFSKPGQLMVVTDSHTTTHGAFGAFGTGVGATDMATILATGSLWFRVPEILRITLTGTPRKGVFSKDVILHVIGRLGADYAVYKGVEFAGPTLACWGVSERMALCNMSTEMGAKCSYIEPDAVTMEFLKKRNIAEYEIFRTDRDFRYAEELTFDVSDIGPQLAVPSSVDNVEPLENHLGQRIDQAYIGSCTGGRLEDLAVAASMLRGRKIPSTVRLLIVPASRGVLLEAMEKGYIRDLVEAGATLVTPSCAACLGTHQGLLAPGEVCISATNRNFPGRMGSTEAKIFLGSPAAVAASALAGSISDPAMYF